MHKPRMRTCIEIRYCLRLVRAPLLTNYFFHATRHRLMLHLLSCSMPFDVFHVVCNKRHSIDGNMQYLSVYIASVFMCARQREHSERVTRIKNRCVTFAALPLIGRCRTLRCSKTHKRSALERMTKRQHEQMTRSSNFPFTLQWSDAFIASLPRCVHHNFL